MSLTIADKILLIIAITNFGGAIICISISLYMAYMKLDIIFSHFKSSPAIIALIPLRHGGPWGKLLVIASISSYLTFPNGYIKRGSLSSQYIENFPIRLKRILVTTHKIGLGLLLVMFGIWATIEFNLF
jgi:hypothetical protein